MKRTLLIQAAKLLPGIQSIAQPTTITRQGKLIDTIISAITQNNSHDLSHVGVICS